ncbi:Mrp/NBP35 family ATP-binding protein [Chloroflexi bacterium TSY]|nr:Mrp/NBP35 family ATP-binding protein [Chloroflexi bacterium TSY]
MSGKGGVGKSALTANLAAALGAENYRVGVLDADIHGASAAAMLGARGQQVMTDTDGARPAVGVADVRVMSMDLFVDGDSPVVWQHPGGLAADTFVWRGTLEANVLREFLADTAWGALDYLLIDMPPGADRFETLMRLAPNISGALIVTIPSQVSHLVVHRSIAAARDGKARLLGLVENMAGFVDGEQIRDLFPLNDGETFAAEMDIPYLGRIPFDPRLTATTDAGRPFVLEHRETLTGQAILALARTIEEKLELT